MNRVIKALALATALVAAWPALAAPAPRGGNEIPFVGFGGIQNWTANDDSTLYVQARGGPWYEVDMAQPCTGLPFALRIGVASGPMDTLDSFSTILVDGNRCQVASVTRLASPPPRGRTAARKN